MAFQFSDAELHAKAVQLGVINDGETLPPAKRSRVAAALVAEQTPAPKAGEPVLARHVGIEPGGAITVDGEPFPWLVAREPMAVHLDPEGVSTVRLTLLADSVTITPKPESE